MRSVHALTGQLPPGLPEDQIEAWASGLKREFGAQPVSLGLVFLSPGTGDPDALARTARILDIIRVCANVPLLIGCSSQALIADGEEIEEQPGIVLGLYNLPGAELQVTRFNQDQVAEASTPAFWHEHSGLSPSHPRGFLTFADPFHMDCEAWLRQWNAAYPGIPNLGGLASGGGTENRTQVFHNGDVFEDGGITLAVGGKTALLGVVSQGCTPIGQTWTITKVERNLIREIANRPAYEVLLDTYQQLTPEEQRKTQGNLFAGLVVNEYLEEFGRGDFLIRNLLGADPKSGAIAIGAFPRVGQTMQFQRRDAEAADEDMRLMLAKAKRTLGTKRTYGGCLCSCNGRGTGLFGKTSHDAKLVQTALGPTSVAGFFCNGELGPVGDRSFLHGYTASLALFCDA